MGRLRAGGDPRRSSRSAAAARSSREEHIFRTDVPKVFASGDVRTGAATVVEAIGEGRRARYAIDYWLRGHDLDDPQVRRIVTEPQPNFLTIVPFTDDVKEPKAIMGKLGPGERKTNFNEYEFGYTRRPGHGGGLALPPVHLRGDRPLRPARGRDRVRDDAEHGDRRALDPGQPVRRRQPRLRPRQDALVHPARLPRCIDCGRCAQVCKEIVGAGCYDFIGKGFDSLVTTADFVCLDGRHACHAADARDVPGRRSHAAPAHPGDLPARRRRCIFCGICADACPYDALRCGPEFEFSEYQRDLPMLDILEMSDRERPTR